MVGTLDTNCDPDDVDYGIPANDDAIRSVRLLADFIAHAVIAGVGVPVTAADMGEVAVEAAAVEAVEGPCRRGRARRGRCPCRRGRARRGRCPCRRIS